MKYLSLRQFAKKLGVSYQAIWDRVKAGDIYAFDIGEKLVIPDTVLEDWKVRKTKARKFLVYCRDNL